MNYKFKLNMDDSYKQYIDYDEWGAAIIDFGIYGAEYNFYIKDGNNCSAIYFMEFNSNTGYWDTDFNDFKHYEIDFNNYNWKIELEKEMYKFVIHND